MKRILSLGLAIVAVTACDKSTSSDPKTATRDALTPPSGLITVTGDKQIELRWQGSNAEEDFKGYRVFATAKKLTELTAPKYPTDYSLEKLRTGSVPRCDQNSALFVDFGFPAIEEGDKECEGDEATDSGTDADAKALHLRGNLVALADESTDTDTDSEADEEALPPQVVKCKDTSGKDLSSAQLSLAVSGNALSEQVCVVSALADGTAFANGTTYTFFVAAIMADDEFDKVQVSWTSNFVEDTPAMKVFEGTVELEAGKMQYISLDDLQSKATFSALESTDCATGAKPAGCTVYAANNLDAAGIYFGRKGGSATELAAATYPQRTFISAAAGDDIKILLRGPQTSDPLQSGEIATSIPEDQAADSDVAEYDNTGLPQQVTGNQVFDFTVMIANEMHYGKIVVGAVTLEDATDATSKVSYPITVLLQTAAGVRHYLQ